MPPMPPARRDESRPALDNKPAPAFLIRMQIRLGLRVMPAFPEAVLSAEEPDAVVRYIRPMQYQVPPQPGSQAEGSAGPEHMRIPSSVACRTGLRSGRAQ
jgi:hypothetical protein